MLLDAITGRRAKFAVGLLVVVVAGALASRAGEVEMTSDPAVLLPEGAESVRAVRAIERFPSGDVTSAIVVAFRDGGLSTDDRRRLEDLRRELDASGPPRYSEDGGAAVLVKALRDAGEEQVVEAAEEIRAAAAAVEPWPRRGPCSSVTTNQISVAAPCVTQRGSPAGLAARCVRARQT